MTEVEKQATTAKSTELENWKKQEVYVEEDDINQSCISAKWVLSWKVKEGQSITKARLYTWRFKEPRNFPTISSIGVRSIFALEASNRWEINAINVKTAFL